MLLILSKMRLRYSQLCCPEFYQQSEAQSFLVALKFRKILKYVFSEKNVLKKKTATVQATCPHCTHHPPSPPDPPPTLSPNSLPLVGSKLSGPSKSIFFKNHSTSYVFLTLVCVWFCQQMRLSFYELCCSSCYHHSEAQPFF